jgi:hypothetical protein
MGAFSLLAFCFLMFFNQGVLVHYAPEPPLGIKSSIHSIVVSSEHSTKLDTKSTYEQGSQNHVYTLSKDSQIFHLVI